MNSCNLYALSGVGRQNCSYSACAHARAGTHAQTGTFLYLEVVGSTSTIHHYPVIIKHLSGICAGLIQHQCWMDTALVLDSKLFDVFLYLEVVGTTSTIHHYPAFIKHLSGIGAGLIQHQCRRINGGTWLWLVESHHRVVDWLFLPKFFWELWWGPMKAICWSKIIFW